MRFEGNAYFHLPGYGPGHDYFVANKDYDNGEYDLPGGYKLILSCMGSFWRSTEVLFGDARSIWATLVNLGPALYSYSTTPVTQGNWWRARKIHTRLLYQDYPDDLFSINLADDRIVFLFVSSHDEIKKFLAARGLRFGMTEKQLGRYHNEFTSGRLKDPRKLKYPKRFKRGLVELCGVENPIVAAAESGSLEVGEMLEKNISRAQLLHTKWLELATS